MNTRSSMDGKVSQELGGLNTARLKRLDTKNAMRSAHLNGPTFVNMGGLIPIVQPAPASFIPFMWKAKTLGFRRSRGTTPPEIGLLASPQNPLKRCCGQ